MRYDKNAELDLRSMSDREFDAYSDSSYDVKKNDSDDPRYAIFLNNEVIESGLRFADVRYFFRDLADEVENAMREWED